MDVSLTLPNKVVLRAESVPAIVTVKNNTGMKIPVGGTNGYVLRFEIKSADGQSVLPNEKNQPLALELQPGSVVTMTNDLFQCYRIIDINQASVLARVDYGDTSYLSAKEFLNVQDGAELARLKVPNGERMLVQALYTLNRGGHEHVLLRVDDKEGGWTYGATDLGIILRSTPPQMMLDQQGRTHILHRSGPTKYSYHIVSSDGSLLKLENFVGDYKVVRMVAGANGEISVNGKPAEKSDQPEMLRATPFLPDLHR